MVLWAALEPLPCIFGTVFALDDRLFPVRNAPERVTFPGSLVPSFRLS